MCSCRCWGRWDIVLALRDGRLASIDLGAIDGIINFASLHAAPAVIVPFTRRWNKQLFWPIVVLDGVMLVSAVPNGNHYPADLFGGLLSRSARFRRSEDCPSYSRSTARRAMRLVSPAFGDLITAGATLASRESARKREPRTHLLRRTETGRSQEGSLQEIRRKASRCRDEGATGCEVRKPHFSRERAS
jgi:PAP2 superfamily